MCGISRNLFEILHSFLSNRKQRTVLNGISSSWGNSSVGVSQGSILGPLLLLIHINDLTDGLNVLWNFLQMKHLCLPLLHY